jgi:hypothetical protein
MVREIRLYLEPMFAPDQLGSDKIMVHRLKLGRELLPAPVNALVWGDLSGLVLVLSSREHTQQQKKLREEHHEDRHSTRKTRVDFLSKYQKMEE